MSKLSLFLGIPNSTHMNHEVGRLHLGTRGQVLQKELIALGQPQVHASQGIVVEGTDAQHSQTRVVDI